MISIGNDIIDLSHSDTLLCKIHPRFHKRVLNHSEISHIESIEDPEEFRLLLWVYWAAKEASYKALKRILPSLIFSYKRFFFHYELRKVTYDTYTLSCFIEQTQDYIHIIACIDANKQEQLLQGFQKKVYRRQEILSRKNLTLQKRDDSSLIRFALAEDIIEKSNLNLDPQDIQITKQGSRIGSQKIPYLYINNKIQDTILTLSHHGDYLSYAFLSPFPERGGGLF